MYCNLQYGLHKYVCHDAFMNHVVTCRAMPGSDDRDSFSSLILCETGSMIYWSIVSADDIEITIMLSGVVVQQERFSDTDNAMAFVIDQMLLHFPRPLNAT